MFTKWQHIVNFNATFIHMIRRQEINWVFDEFSLNSNNIQNVERMHVYEINFVNPFNALWGLSKKKCAKSMEKLSLFGNEKTRFWAIGNSQWESETIHSFILKRNLFSVSPIFIFIKCSTMRNSSRKCVSVQHFVIVVTVIESLRCDLICQLQNVYTDKFNYLII